MITLGTKPKYEIKLNIRMCTSGYNLNKEGEMKGKTRDNKVGQLSIHFAKYRNNLGTYDYMLYVNIRTCRCKSCSHL